MGIFITELGQLTMLDYIGIFFLLFSVSRQKVRKKDIAQNSMYLY